MTRGRFKPGTDVMLVVTGKYTLLGVTCGMEWEDGQVLVQWEDHTRTRLRSDLLITPGGAAVVESVQVATATEERDRARTLAARLEAQLAQVEEIVATPLTDPQPAYYRILAIRDVLGIEVAS